MFENLETRRMMYSYPNGVADSYDEATNTLHLWATAGNDQLYFQRHEDLSHTWIRAWSGYQGPLNPGYPFATYQAFSGGVLRNIQVHGQNGDDTLIVGPDVIGTVFTLDGGDGNDTMVGGTGNRDAFIGGTGIDTVSYAGRADKISVLLDTQANDGGAGESDYIIADVERVIGGENADILYGNNGPNQLDGGGGRDSIWGVGGNDSLYGGAADDQLDGGAGADFMDGGASGGDKVTYSYRSAPVTIGPDGYANDGEANEYDNIQATVEILVGGSGNDVIYFNHNSADGNWVGKGGPGNDRFWGSPGRDIVFGEAGNDTVESSLGRDYYSGGDGLDVMNYGLSNKAVIVSLDGDENNGAVGERDNVNSDIVRGSKFNDLIQSNPHPAAAAVNNQFFGGDGNDTLRGLAGNDTLDGGLGADQLEGGVGNDSLDGGDARDLIWGDAGHDTLRGSWGNDQLVAGDGDDLLEGGRDADFMTGGEGNDTVTYVNAISGVTVTIDMSASDGTPGEGDNVFWDNENVIGGPGDDIIHGSAKVNILRGGAGNDQLFGYEGADNLDGSLGADTLDGGAGIDTADYSTRNQKLWISIGDSANDGELNELDKRVLATVENVRGGSNNDVITDNPGSTVASEFWGGGGADLLKGWGGGDTLHGDAGIDTLEGGEGLDILDGGAAGDYLDGGAASDHAWYANRVNAVVVTLDVTKNDGEPGENDFVMGSVECITGGFGNDTLTGNSGANAIYGQGGNDTITGGAGIDTLNGGSGNDLIESRDNAIDHVFGGAGTDKARIDPLEDLSQVETLLA